MKYVVFLIVYMFVGVVANADDHVLDEADIAPCLACTQCGTVIISSQKVVLDKWCIAEVYDIKGMHVLAAKIRCSLPDIASYFDTVEACVSGNAWAPDATDIIEHIQAEQAIILSRLEEYDAKLNTAPPAPIRSAYGITDEQKAAIKEVLK